jgi:hypothetical protein
VNADEAEQVRLIYRLYLELKCVHRLKRELDRRGVVSKVRISQAGHRTGGVPFFRGALYCLLKNRLYRGEIAHRGAVYPGQQEAILPLDLWEAVQALLAANNQAKRTGVYARDPSLLAGLLFDDRGHRMTPIHTIRRGKRYRYYVSQAVLQNQTAQPGTVGRIPALDIEQHLTRRLETWLTAERELLNQLVLPTDETVTHTTLLAGAKIWKHLGTREPAQVRAFLLATVRRITVEATAVHLTLSRSGLRAVLLRGHEIPTTGLRARTHQEEQEDDIPLSVDVTLRRGARGIRLIVPGESAVTRTAQPNPALITAVARAHVWAGRLLSGEAPSLRAIAREHGASEGYVGRILRCAFLAPDLVEAILQGRQAPTLTLNGLFNTLPLEWSEQRQVLGQHSRVWP